MKKRPVVVVRIVPASEPDKEQETKAGVHMEDWRPTGSVIDTWVWGALPGAADREALSFQSLAQGSDIFQLSVQHWSHASNMGSLPPKTLGVADFSIHEDVLSLPSVNGVCMADLKLPLIADVDTHDANVSGSISLRVAAEVMSSRSASVIATPQEARFNYDAEYDDVTAFDLSHSAFEALAQTPRDSDAQTSLSNPYDNIFGSANHATKAKKQEDEGNRALNFAPRL